MLTDSRGFCPNRTHKDTKLTHLNWVDKFVDRNPLHDVDAQNWKGARLSNIFGQVKYIMDANKTYDLIVLQCGNHEYIQCYSESIMSRVVSYIMYVEGQPNCIWPPSAAQMKRALKDKHIVKIGPDRFRYRNDKLVNKYIKYLKSKTKHLLLIGMQYTTSPKLGLIMNNVYSKNVDYLHLPFNVYWQYENCYDGMHYNELAAEIVCSYVERYIKRSGQTTNSVLQNVCS